MTLPAPKLMPPLEAAPDLTHQRICPHAGDALLHGGFRSLADLHHGDHGADGDDDAQGAEGRAHLVSPQGGIAVTNVRGNSDAKV